MNGKKASPSGGDFGRDFGCVILAAGEGTRMKSRIPKVLHPICGAPLLDYVLRLPESLSIRKIAVVAGRQKKLVRSFIKARARVVEQRERRGSGHALLQAWDLLKAFPQNVLVLYGDTPLIDAESLRSLLKIYRQQKSDGVLLSAKVESPNGYGRVIRNAQGGVERIVEEANASRDEKAIHEINVGAYCFNKNRLFDALKEIRPDEKKKEYYLTDVIAQLAKTGRVMAFETENEGEALGVNSPTDLVAAETRMRDRILRRLLSDGVRIRDPRTVVIDADVKVGPDTVIHPFTVIEGPARIGGRCQIGPFARIRAGVTIGDEAVIGNFVEVVRSRIGDRTLVKHLTYLGDAEVGKDVNVGAGTITANFDGRAKHRTVIRDGVQLGSGTIIIAPATLGQKARSGAGAVIKGGTKVPQGSTVVGVPAKGIKKKKKH